MLRLTALTTALCALLFLSGCASHVPVDVELAESNYYNPLHDHTKVVVQIPESVVNQVHTEQGLLAIGPTHRWNVAFGESIADAAEGFFGEYFNNLTIQSNTRDAVGCDDCGLIIRPSVEYIDVSTITLQTTVKFKVSYYDALGREVYVTRATGESPLLGGVGRISGAAVSLYLPLIGELIGGFMVSDSVEDAFEDAYAQLGRQQAIALDEGVLARSWLPRELIKKHSYGRYEYSAEQLAKHSGCDLTSDGVKLIKSDYKMLESYEAYCFDRGLFTIDCEFGQCRERQRAQVVSSPTLTTTIESTP